MHQTDGRTNRQRLPDRDSGGPNKFLQSGWQKKNLKLHNYKHKALQLIAARINFFSPVTGFGLQKCIA